MTQTQTQNQTGVQLSDLDWPLIFILGAVALVRPTLSILGYSDGRPWLSILATVLIMVVWIGAVLIRRVQQPIITLVAVGGMYAVLAMVLNVGIQRNFSRLPLIGIVGILATNLVWGGISGLIASGIRRVLE